MLIILNYQSNLKGETGKKISREDYQETILNHNLTPRKSLNWLTPLEAFTQNIHLVALQT